MTLDSDVTTTEVATIEETTEAAKVVTDTEVDLEDENKLTSRDTTLTSCQEEEAEVVEEEEDSQTQGPGTVTAQEARERSTRWIVQETMIVKMTQVQDSQNPSIKLLSEDCSLEVCPSS